MAVEPSADVSGAPDYDEIARRPGSLVSQAPSYLLFARGDDHETRQTGESLPDRGVRVFDRDLVTGELFTTGTNVVAKLPDGGVSIGGAGRLVFDAAGVLVTAPPARSSRTGYPPERGCSRAAKPPPRTKMQRSK